MRLYNKDEKTGELYHHGIKGQRWGIRRFQNEDGSYTTEGVNRRKEQIKNYTKTIKSLSKKEFNLYTGNPNESKSQDIAQFKRNIKLQPYYKNSMAIVSKNGNVTMAYLNNHPVWGKQWAMAWATDPKARGTGVTQANLKETIELIKENGDIPISAIIAPENIASIKTAEKAGFKEVATIYDPQTNKYEKKYVYGDNADKMKKAYEDKMNKYKKEAANAK